MKIFGRKGKSVCIEVIFIIIALLIILCMGFGYCLRFVHREGYDYEIININEMKDKFNKYGLYNFSEKLRKWDYEKDGPLYLPTPDQFASGEWTPPRRGEVKNSPLFFR